MHKINNFKLQIQEPIKEELYNYPGNSLDEYTDFEMGLKGFCFEHNCYVLLEVGNEQIKLHLYHDILDALEDRWCRQILELSSDNKISIGFVDLILDFIPIKDKNEVTCEFGFIGTGKIQSYRLCLSQVLEEMSTFINKVLGMAVKKGYISTEDIDKYLGWRLNRILL